MDRPRRECQWFGGRWLSEWELRSSLLCCWSERSLLILCGRLWGWRLLVHRGGCWKKVAGFAGLPALEAHPHSGMALWCEGVVGCLQLPEGNCALMQFANISGSSFSVRWPGIKGSLLVDTDLLDEAMSSRW